MNGLAIEHTWQTGLRSCAEMMKQTQTQAQTQTQTQRIARERPRPQPARTHRTRAAAPRLESPRRAPGPPEHARCSQTPTLGRAPRSSQPGGRALQTRRGGRYVLPLRRPPPSQSALLPESSRRTSTAAHPPRSQYRLDRLAPLLLQGAAVRIEAVQATASTSTRSSSSTPAPARGTTPTCCRARASAPTTRRPIRRGATTRRTIRRPRTGIRRKRSLGRSSACGASCPLRF